MRRHLSKVRSDRRGHALVLQVARRRRKLGVLRASSTPVVVRAYAAGASGSRGPENARFIADLEAVVRILGRTRLAFDAPRVQPREMTRTNQIGPRAKQATELASADEPPVVARLVVEIRSDGSRTIARGAFEDGQLGERTSLEVEGATPSQLALSLAKALFQAPVFARSVAQALLTGRTKIPDERG